MNDKQVQSVLKDINKQFGLGTAMVLGERQDLDIDRVSSGSLNLDLALGGGMPLGRTIELYGPESSGKTTVALLHAAKMQKRYPDKYVLFVDLEHAIDPKILRDYGVDDKRVIISQPDFGEQALDIVEAFIRSDTVSLVIVDSVSALTPEAEAKGQMGDQQIGLQARLMSKALRKLTPPAAKYGTEVIFINQIREKVGVMYGNPETTSGGRALSFYASIRIHVRAGERIPDPKNKDQVIGHVINVRVVKNKTAQPWRKASFDLIYGVGVDNIKEIAEIALEAGYVQRGGAYYQVRFDPNDKDTVIERNVPGAEEGAEPVKLSFQGKESFVDYLKEDEALFEIIRDAVFNGEVGNEEYYESYTKLVANLQE